MLLLSRNKRLDQNFVWSLLLLHCSWKYRGDHTKNHWSFWRNV